MALQINEENNVGSLSAIWLALAYQVATINPFAFIGAFAWLIVDYLPESAQVTESSAIVDGGTEWTYQLVFAVNMLNADMLATAKLYIGQFGIIQYTDNNGLVRLLGRKDNPVTITIDTDTGLQYISQNGLSLKAVWVDNNPSPTLP